MALRHQSLAAWQWVPAVGELVFQTSRPRTIGVVRQVVMAAPVHGGRASIQVEFPDGIRTIRNTRSIFPVELRISQLGDSLRRLVSARDAAADRFGAPPAGP